MKEKGFTLMELLAVIVILAIIALIAVPIILNIIVDAKKQSNLRSAELYVDAVDKAIASYNLSNEFPTRTRCSVTNEGLKCNNGVGTIAIDANGIRPTKGTIVIVDGAITAVERLKLNESTYRLVDDKLVLVDPSAATDESCFMYVTTDITWGSSTAISNVDKCKTVTRKYIVDKAEDGAEVPDDSTLESICNGTNEITPRILATLDSYYAYQLYEAGALANAEIEELDGAKITGYTCEDIDIVIPSTLGGNNVTAIGWLAFNGKQLMSVTIPDSVTTIGYFAFNNNELEELKLGNGVKTIGSDAFSYNKLTSVTLGNSVTTIEDSAFGENNLTSVTLGNSVTTISKKAFYKNELTSVTIPNSVKTIGSDAFGENNLTSVTLGNSVETIGDYAFSYNKLTSVTIPSSVTTIGHGAFGCGTDIRNGETYGPNAITSVTLIGKNSTSEFESYGNDVFCWITGKSDANIKVLDNSVGS